MKLNNNTDFFSRAAEQPAAIQPESAKTASSPVAVKPRQEMKFSGNTLSLINRTKKTLQACGLSSLTSAIEKIQKDAVKERFVVSVVGEFSRGKSTFLNHLLDNSPMLPTGDLPTTAMMTRIRYSTKPQIAVFDENGNRMMLQNLTPEVWQGLTVNVSGGKDPKGVAYVGIRHDWLGRNNLEFIDCPGAGDLSEERAKQIGDALNRTDGAIIAISALAALSSSERLFIKQRIVERKTPFAMLVVTKLDQVNLAERSSIIRHIKDLLSLHNFDIPVFIPYDIEMPDNTYESVTGLDKVKKTVESWIEDPTRQELTERWLRGRVSEVVKMAVNILQEQQKLLSQDADKRRKKVAEQRMALENLALEWGDFSLKLQERGNKCYEQFLGKVEEYQASIIERLQYEVSHTNDPKRWLAEDYPYRLKVELANMSVGLENVVARQANQDAHWFNTRLEQKFKTLIQTGNMSVTDKADFTQSKSESTIELEDVSKKATMARIGTVALTLAGFFMLGPGMGILATMGIGTGGALLSNKMIKDSIEGQKTEIKKFLTTDVPCVISKAIVNSEQRVRSLYGEMLNDSQSKLDAWVEAQKQAIEKANASDVAEQIAKNDETIFILTEIDKQL